MQIFVIKEGEQKFSVGVLGEPEKDHDALTWGEMVEQVIWLTAPKYIQPGEPRYHQRKPKEVE